MKRLCHPRPWACRTLLLTLALPLGACVKDRVEATGSLGYPNDYRERHSIVLTDAPRTLDVFTGSSPSGLDRRQRQDVYTFGLDYEQAGKGPMTAFVPLRRDAATRPTLAAIRDTLEQAGVYRDSLAVVSYTPDDPLLVAPIRLKFARLQAKVAGQCGQWPADLSGGPSTEGWHNRTYWNFGCATQVNLANQVADPVDLVRGRQETPVDTQKRLGAIGKIRRGQDPSTTYKEEAGRINQSVGN